VGQGSYIDSNTVRCIVEDMDLVNEGEALPVSIALNSYSWVGGHNKVARRMLSETHSLSYLPYGIIGVTPDSGPFEGFTDILVTGKGFSEEIAAKAKCRFGVDGDYAIVDAEVIDFTKLVCRSPGDMKMPDTAGESYSVPFGISFNDDEFRPWTKDLHRFRFYTAPIAEVAIPDEVKIGKMAEIFVIAQEGSRFTQRKVTFDYFYSGSKWKGGWLRGQLLLRRLRHQSGHGGQFDNGSVLESPAARHFGRLLPRDGDGRSGAQRTGLQRGKQFRRGDLCGDWEQHGVLAFYYRRFASGAASTCVRHLGHGLAGVAEEPVEQTWKELAAGNAGPPEFRGLGSARLQPRVQHQ